MVEERDYEQIKILSAEVGWHNIRIRYYRYLWKKSRGHKRDVYAELLAGHHASIGKLESKINRLILNN